MTTADVAELERVPRSRSRVKLWRRLTANPKALAGLLILAPLTLIAILGPAIAPYDYAQVYLGSPLEGPSQRHWLGTDINGRDVLSRLIIGTRIVLGVPMVVGLGALVIGVPLGLLAGYARGVADSVIMRVVDIFLSFPWLLVGLAMASVLGPGLRTVIITLIIVYWPQVARVTRNSVLTITQSEYVEAGRALGEGRGSLMFRYVLRNAYFPVLVLLSSMLAFAILNEAGISYLGFGVQSPNTSWGLELATGGTYINSAPHLVIAPGIAIVFVVLGMNLLADGLGDVLAEQGGGE